MATDEICTNNIKYLGVPSPLPKYIHNYVVLSYWEKCQNAPIATDLNATFKKEVQGGHL